jgi:hypothetical protein
MWNHCSASGVDQRVQSIMAWAWGTGDTILPDRDLRAIHRPGLNSYSHFIFYDLTSVLTKTTKSFLRWEPIDLIICHQVLPIKGPYYLSPDHTEDQASNTWIHGTQAISKPQHLCNGPIEKCKTRELWDLGKSHQQGWVKGNPKQKEGGFCRKHAETGWRHEESGVRQSLSNVQSWRVHDEICQEV